MKYHKAHIGKPTLFHAGKLRVKQFCKANRISTPKIDDSPGRWPFSACAYYRSDTIFINLKKCSGVGTAGSSWSYPGYAIDRTPFGVLAHELGHHVESIEDGMYNGGHGKSPFANFIRYASGNEPKLTGYAPNNSEWFAEMFRLFVTNPDLLKHIRPGTYEALAGRFTPVEKRTWQAVLKDAPLRTREMAARKVQDVGI